MKYIFHPEAEEELNLAVDYYNQCQANLGWDLSREVYTAIQNVLAFHTLPSPIASILYRRPKTTNPH